MADQVSLDKSYLIGGRNCGLESDGYSIYCTPRNHQGTIATGKMRKKVKFAAFGCVFLTKIKVYPESWCNKLSIKQPSKKKIPKDNFT